MKRPFTILITATAVFSMLFGSAGVAAASTPAEVPSAEVVERPDVVRGFNTYGAAMTQENAEALRTDYNANVVRLQIHPQNYAQKHKVTLEQAWEAVLTETELGLQEAARQGLMTVLDLHSVPIPGSKNAPAFWADDATSDVLVACWEEIVTRFAPYRDYIWGYDLLNEAHNTAELPLGASKWHAWAQKMTDAIRALDPDTAIIYEASPGALPRGFKENEWIDAGPGYPVQYQGDFELLDDDNVIYSVHWYELHNYTHQGIGTNNNAPTSADWPDKMIYPGVNAGVEWNKDTLRELMQPVVDFQEKYDVPIYVGEFSAVRWAPGASEYIRDSVELFEEHAWSWTYHSFQDWHGWQLNYTDTMTSDANSASAIATEPTDRELTLKAHFSQNQFVAPLTTPRPVVNMLKNGNFAVDADANGVADGWSLGANALGSLVDADGAPAQKIVLSANNQKGVDQEWVTVSDKRRYVLKARVRVDSGQLRFWHYGVTSTYSFAGDGLVAAISPSGGEYVDREVDFVPAPGTAKLSVRFWSNAAADFTVAGAELIDLGPAEVTHPPRTSVEVSSASSGASTSLTFSAAAHDGASVARTEYRVVGASEEWLSADGEVLTLTEPGRHIVGYRSVDSAGLVEAGRAIIADVVAKPAATTVPTISGTAEVRHTLKADPGVWAPSEVELAIQWLRDGQPIDAATDPDYRVTAADAGTTLSVRIDATAPSTGSTGSVETTGAFVRHPSRTTVTPNRIVGNSSDTFAVTIRVSSSGGQLATGSVTLLVDHTRYTGALVDGVATIELLRQPRGVHRLVASYDGDETVASSSGKSGFVVIR